MGEDEIAVSSRFYKVMLHGFQERLKLPPAFCRKVKHEKSERAILESCKGKWKMNACREEDDQIILKDGWPRFADAHGLTIGDLILFQHTAKLHFNVVVCGRSGCEKQFFVDDPPHNMQHQDEKGKAPRDSQSPCFSSVMTRYTAFHKNSKVTVPLQFVKSNELEGKASATLKDPRGRKWTATLQVQNWPLFRMQMGWGWHKFAAANDLKVGDQCSFHLKPTNSPTSKNMSFDVSIFRKKSR